MTNESIVVDRRRRHWAIANGFSIVGLIFFGLYYLTGFRFDTLFTVEARQVDFTIWRIIPSYILEHHRYPSVVTGDWIHAIFPYLPSAAVMMLPLSVPSQTVGFAIWLLIESIAFVIVIWASLRLSEAVAQPGAIVIAIAAVLLNGNSLGLEFRNHNTNIVYLALVMLGLQTRWTWLSALFLALSFNLKLYSGVLIGVLAWRREYRLASGIALVAILIAVLLPMTVFGAAAFPQLMADWVAQIRYTLSPDNQLTTTASLFRSVAAIMKAVPSSEEVSALVRGTQAVWLSLILTYFFVAGRARPSQKLTYGQARLSDVCVALITPLPLSSWFIPYHAIVMLPAFVLLIAVAVDAGWPTWVRGVAIAACTGSQIVRFALRDYDYRGAIFLTCFIFLVLALAVVRGTQQSREIACIFEEVRRPTESS